MIASAVVWALVANMLYFNELSSAPRECGAKSLWVSLWNFFTFGVDDLFPFGVGVSSTSLETLIQGGESYCSQRYFFDPLGYGYFLLMPVAIVVGCVLLYRWTQAGGINGDTH